MRIVAVAFACVLIFVACQQTGVSRPVQSPGAPSSVSAAAPERPWKASAEWSVTRLEWPEGQPPFSGVTSTFGGRCSVPSDYVIFAAFKGEATHTGRFSGEGSHCTQLHLTPAGPKDVTYSDGRGALQAANGSTLTLRWGDGITWTDEMGVTWFKDAFTFAGGTGIFAGATGGGEEGGSFTDFMALLAGKPAAMWQTGTIAYGGEKR